MQTVKILRSLLAAGLLGTGAAAWGATQYWDTAATAGIQGGDGAWSAGDALWSSTRLGTALEVWTDGNDAWFVAPSNSTASSITLNTSLNAGSVNINGGPYTLNVINGGQLLAGAADSVIGSNAANNTVMIVGGAGVTSLWEVGTSGAKKALTIGYGNTTTRSNNVLWVDGAGSVGSAVVTNAALIKLGDGAIASGTMPYDSRMVVTNGAHIYSEGLSIGYGARYISNNVVILTEPGSFWDMGGIALKVGVGTGNGYNNNNEMWIANGAVMTNVGAVQVNGPANPSASAQNGFNQLIITNGGKLYSGAALGSFGSWSSNSIIVVGGAGVTSLWSCSASFNAGTGGSNNLFLIDGLGATGSAVVAGMNTITLGSGSGTGNKLLVRGGGVLSTTNPVATGTGPGNMIIFESGAQVTCTGATYGIQLSGLDSSLDMSGAGTMVNPGSKQVAMGTASNHSLAIRDGAVLTNCTIYPAPTLINNYLRMDVTGGGKVYANNPGGGNPIYLQGGSATFTVSGAESFLDCDGAYLSVGGYGSIGTNTLLIANDGVLTNVNRITLSHDSGTATYRNVRDNNLVITNGGKLFTGGGISYVGYGSGYHSNNIVVRDLGSLWQAGGDLVIGNIMTSTGNFVTVDNAGVITNVGAVTFSARNGRLTITNGGSFYSTNTVTLNGSNSEVMVTGSNSTWSLGGMDLIIFATNHAVVIDQGGAVNNVDALTVRSNSLVNLLGGTLSVSNMAYSNGLFTVGDGFQAATLRTLGGTLTFTNGLLVSSNATLTGKGLIRSASTVFGTLSPGTEAAGSLTNSGALTLQPLANTVIKLAAATTPGAGWNYLAVKDGALQLDGTLSVLLTGGFAPDNTQSFLIMTNLSSSISGSFANAPGNVVPAYTNMGGEAVGRFRVTIEPARVLLSAFSTLQKGTIFMFR